MNGRKPRMAAFEGWYTMEDERPHLIGSRCTSCGSYFFPRTVFGCRNPQCQGTSLEDAKLSRTGKIWSYTNACYRPPPPFVSPEPFVPFAIAAVELERERMIVLGQVVSGVDVQQLRIGTLVELVLETLYAEGQQERVVWKWKLSDRT